MRRKNGSNREEQQQQSHFVKVEGEKVAHFLFLSLCGGEIMLPRDGGGRKRKKTFQAHVFGPNTF